MRADEPHEDSAAPELLRALNDLGPQDAQALATLFQVRLPYRRHAALEPLAHFAAEVPQGQTAHAVIEGLREPGVGVLVPLDHVLRVPHRHAPTAPQPFFLTL